MRWGLIFTASDGSIVLLLEPEVESGHGRDAKCLHVEQP
jgi:hypothetical protein